MRVQTEEWRRFIPGVRMYKGKMTLFYNGEKLRENGVYHIYTEEERQTWEVIIVLPGVEIIPEYTFYNCVQKVKVVIMSDTVRRIEDYALSWCRCLEFVKLSRNLEYIGQYAFSHCELTSIFIPPSCREIRYSAFQYCTKLIIFSVPQHIQLGDRVIDGTALKEKCQGRNLNHWVQNLHADNVFSLHRVCSSLNPSAEVIFDIVKGQDLGAFKKPDNAGITASQYLSENPFTEIKEQQIVKRYILGMMGEVDKGVNMNEENRKRPREDINNTETG